MMTWSPKHQKMTKIKALSEAIDLLTQKPASYKVTLMLKSLRAQRQELLKSMGPIKEVK